MDIVEITTEAIDIEKTLSKLKDVTSGATSVFIGTTRNHHDGKEVLRLEYEAYVNMAVNEMKKTCEAMRRKWPLLGIAIIHRIGSVPAGEISIFIAANSVHRKAAQESVMFCIDTVKATVPIWKKEWYSDGSSNWKSNNECLWTNE